MTSKIQLRKHFRAIRKKIPVTYREQAAIKAAKIFTALPIFKNSTAIACYLPYQEEFDSSLLIEALWHANKHCYLPVLKDEQSLFFVRYRYGDALHLNRHGILEPIHTAQMIKPENLDINITPLLAFDLAGHRLGTGGGYYDRTFAYLLEDGPKKPHMIGLGYQAQQAGPLPSDPWDVLLEGVITEEKYIEIPKVDYAQKMR